MKFWLTLIILFLLSTRSILASDRNIFGLHLTQVSDIDNAHSIINSNGGDWGWTTIVMRLDDLNKSTWQDFMDKCRTDHVIPIIRVGTIMDQGHWKRPENSDLDTFANFLNNLNWPTKTQYVIPFNEINHAEEWGGSVDIKSFTDSFIYTSQKLKSLNPNFFILSTPLDYAAPENPPAIRSATNVLKDIYSYNPKYFNSFDGLASHSYPNHGFIGTPQDSGQHSIRGYLWEQSYLKSLGVTKNYPVFITETGWPHREGENNKNNFYTTNTSASFLIKALDLWGSDSQIKAVTPFIYNFPYAPFDHFSWVDKLGRLYPSYQTVLDLSKTKNIPSQITSYEVENNPLPWLIFPDKEYFGSITLKNTGQSIWGETNFCLTPSTSPNVRVDTLCTSDTHVFPGHSETFSYKFKISPSAPYQNTFIGWKNLGTYEIGLIKGNPTIYLPKQNLLDQIKLNFYRFFSNLNL